jgi:1-acyl-sn-glycerol-3-phosphate acyltransferase
MKKLKFATLAVLALSSVARAEPVTMQALDCSVLSGTTFVCVRNEQAATITGIACAGVFGETELSVPGGSIASGGTAIVDFRKSKCNKLIRLKMRIGPPIEIKGFDVEKNAVLHVTKD